ncbi:MAG: CotH kinase family protein, partial [Clostridia bacterium]|nr:CotH kinase family protein [Clostridia bacterium]
MPKLMQKALSILLTACLCFFLVSCTVNISSGTNGGNSNVEDGAENGGETNGEEPTPYEVPVIKINTNGASIDSKIDYTDMTFSLEKVDNPLTNVEGGIRLRGNSTKDFAKKPYRIKFDSKQSLFGLEKAKSWVLLAEYLDPSGLRNYSAFKLASQMPDLAFTPTPHKVEVYLNGENMGLYTLCEQVQENKGRMDIELDEITADMTDLFDFNFFISMDASCREDEDAVLDETYFYLEEYDRYFELKYPEKDQFVSNEQFLS